MNFELGESPNPFLSLQELQYLRVLKRHVLKEDGILPGVGSQMLRSLQARKLERGRVLKFLLEVHREGGIFLSGLRGGGRLGNVDLDVVVVCLMGREELRSGACIFTSVLGTEHI